MNSILEYIGGLAIAISFAFGLIKYFAQKVFEQELAKNLEKFKSDLNKESKAVEIELNKLANIYQTKFNSLHVERATIIKVLYENIYNYNIAVADFFLGSNNENPAIVQSKIEAWTNAVVDFSNHFHLNRIFFKKETADKLDKLNNQMDEINVRKEIVEPV